MALAPDEAPIVFLSAPTVVTLSSTVRQRLTTTVTSGKKGIVLTPSPGNGSAVIYVGGSVVTDTADWFMTLSATDGPTLLPFGDASQIYVYSTGAPTFGWAVL